MESLSQGKVCSKCKLRKDRVEFSACKANADGLFSYCKACKKIYNRANLERTSEYRRKAFAEWRKNNLEYDRARGRAHYATNSEKRKQYRKSFYQTNADQVKQYSSKYRRAHLAKYSAESARYRRANPEKYKASIYRWKDRNPGLVREWKRNYRARRRQAHGYTTDQEWVDLCAFYGNVCLACASSGPLTVDHVIPLSKGGSNAIDNLQPLCGPCNSGKRDRVVDYRKDHGV